MGITRVITAWTSAGSPGKAALHQQLGTPLRVLAQKPPSIPGGNLIHEPGVQQAQMSKQSDGMKRLAQEIEAEEPHLPELKVIEDGGGKQHDLACGRDAANPRRGLHAIQLAHADVAHQDVRDKVAGQRHCVLAAQNSLGFKTLAVENVFNRLRDRRFVVGHNHSGSICSTPTSRLRLH